MRPHVLQHTDQGAGETIVLLPGGLTGWASFEPLLPLLTARHRVINVQPYANAEGILGHVGTSTYTADFERENIRLTLEAADAPASIHLLGWSNGGRLALDFALAHLDRVETVTVVEPAAWWLLGDRDDAAAFEAFVRRLHGNEVSDSDLVEFLVRAGLGPEGTDFQSLPGWPVWQRCRNALSWFGPAALESAQAGIADLEALERPVLCVRGTTTSAWLRDVVDVLVERLPMATVLDLAGGHASLLQHPETFVDAVTQHVAGAPPLTR